MLFPVSVSREKLFRRLDQRLAPASAFSRFSLHKAATPVGRRRGHRFFFYFPARGSFSLFAPTLYGVLGKDGKLQVSLSRSRPLLVLWLLWCGILLYTGIGLLPAEWDFALWFLIPGVILPIPAFLLGKKEKERLLKELRSLAEP